MLGLILAAGLSKRLQGINNGHPKCYLKVGGRAILDRGLGLFAAAGVRESVVVTGYKKYVLEADYAGRAQFVFNPFFQQTNTLASMWMGLAGIDEDVLSMNGDTVFEPEVLLRLRATPGDIVLACDTQKCGEEEVKYRTDGRGRVLELNKEIHPNRAEGEFSGVCLIRRSALAPLRLAQEKILADNDFNAYFEAGFEALVKAAKLNIVSCDISDLKWCEIDFPADYERASELFPARASAETTSSLPAVATDAA
jgi:L-glutamine-phosphate cytidylyltransferase